MPFNSQMCSSAVTSSAHPSARTRIALVLPCPTIAPISALFSISVTPTFLPRWFVP